MGHREQQPNEVEQLYLEALKYDFRGDVYNAVKVCKRIIRLEPDWSAPFSFLSLFYKYRNEWRTSMHYSQKAVENNPFDEAAWQNLGIAATALQKWELARIAWNRLGFQFEKRDQAIQMNLGLIPVRINPSTNPEIIWATRIDTARAVIESIPQPASDRRFKDIILVDGDHKGYRIAKNKKLPVYDELQLLKFSPHRTFVTLLQTSCPEEVNVLDKLCFKAGLGFDNWSKANRIFVNRLDEKLPEYFDEEFIENFDRESYLVAIAALKKQEVMKVLKAWRVITLKRFTQVKCFVR